ncbi:MAG: c(7)-type cytochrome triheme domain-containing protein [Desulfobulbaceae bacterium]
MKMYKKILGAFGVAACAGILFAVAGMAEAPAGAPAPAKEAEAYDEDTYGPEKAIVWNKPVPRVQFSHKVHTMDAGLACDSCHDDLFTMEAGASESKEDFTMAGFMDGKYCGACHDGSTAFHTNSPEKCASCHTPPGTIVFTKPVKAVVFDHKKHVDDLGFNCTNCHSDLFKMIIGDAEKNEQEFVMDALYNKKYCGACHDGEQAFASNTRCTTCHIGVLGFDRLFGDANAKKKEGHH